MVSRTGAGVNRQDRAPTDVPSLLLGGEGQPDRERRFAGCRRKPRGPPSHAGSARQTWGPNADHSSVNGPPIRILPPVEEGVPLGLEHLQNSKGLAFMLPFLRPGVDGLAGEFGESGGVAGAGHAEPLPQPYEELVSASGA